MASIPFLTAGRLITSLAAISNSISPYIADFNESHVYNPKWPPHARFHNGQTMSMGLLLGLATLYYTWRPLVSAVYGTGLYATKTAARDSMFSAAIIGSLYWISGVSAIFYPGTKWIDPEFVNSKYDGKLLGMPGQLPVFVLHAVFVWVGYALEANRLAALKAE